MGQHRSEDYVRFFIKTVAGNSIPILWLFVFQAFWKVRFDGPVFWSLYGFFSVVVTLVINNRNR